MFNQFNLDEVRDRARAAFIGMAIGDALGATVEFMTKSEIASKYGTHREIVGGGWLRLKPGESMTTFNLAEALWRTGRRKEAAGFYRQYLELTASDGDSQLRKIATARVRLVDASGG